MSKAVVMVVFPGKPSEAIFVERLNRFAAIVNVQGIDTRVFVPNSGRMKELLVAGVKVLLHHDPKPHRTTQYDLVMVEYLGNWVCIDSRMPNRLLEEAFRANAIEEFRGITGLRREVPLGGSRLDFMLEFGPERVFIEAKSVTLVVDGEARFPDAPTPRGARHLRELTEQVKMGNRAGVVFLIQRADAQSFASNDFTDPDFGQALRDAYHAGVIVEAWTCLVEPGQVTLKRPIPYKE